MESQNQAAMDKYKCQYCNYKSMYYKNMQDHVAANHETETVNATGTAVQSNPSEPAQESSLSGSEEEHQSKDDEEDYLREGGVSPHPGAVSPRPGAISPHPGTSSPRPGAISPHPGAISPRPGALSPRPGAVSPRPGAVSPRPKSNKSTAVACEFCNQKFDHKRLKDIHANACHRIGDAFRCPFCKERVLCLDWPEHLKQHNTVLSANPYCQQCNKTFKSMRNLRNHRLEVHGEGQSHACPEENCSSVFARARNLRMHMELHKGSKDHICDVCGEGYALKSSLMKHRKSKHPDEATLLVPGPWPGSTKPKKPKPANEMILEPVGVNYSQQAILGNPLSSHTSEMRGVSVPLPVAVANHIQQSMVPLISPHMAQASHVSPPMGQPMPIPQMVSPRHINPQVATSGHVNPQMIPSNLVSSQIVSSNQPIPQMVSPNHVNHQLGSSSHNGNGGNMVQQMYPPTQVTVPHVEPSYNSIEADQVKREPQLTDSGLLSISKPGIPSGSSPQRPMLAIPQPRPSDLAQEIEGMVSVMQSSDINSDVSKEASSAPPLGRTHSKKVIKRQSSMDLGNMKFERQSPMDLGGENPLVRQLANASEALEQTQEEFKCRYCKDVYFATAAELQNHILQVHKVTSSQDAADQEAAKHHKPEAKIVSQFSNTPHTQLSEDLIEAAYLVSMQEEQRRTYADTNANMQQ